MDTAIIAYFAGTSEIAYYCHAAGDKEGGHEKNPRWVNQRRIFG
jgi:hypothetical protein